MNNGWTFVAALACVAALGHWCMRPTTSLTGGGGLGSMSSPQELLPDLFTPAKFLWSVAISILLGDSAPQHKQLVVAVASSLNNVERRNAIRKTWKTLAQKHEAKLFFVMAEHPCKIDPYWRIRETSCTPWRVSVPHNSNDNMAVRPIRIVPSMIRPGAGRDGLGFTVKFPVTVDNLAVAKRALTQYFTEGEKDKRNLVVELVDANNLEMMASVSFFQTRFREDSW